MLAERLSRRQRWLTLVGASALLGAGAVGGAPLRAQVVWETVTPKQAEKSQILVPAVDGGGPVNNAPAIVWERVVEPKSKTLEGWAQPSEPAMPQAVVWEPLPSDPSGDGAVAAPTTVVWEPLPSTDAIAEIQESTETITLEESTTLRVEQQEAPPPEALAIEQELPSRVPELPPPPPLQALNRSIAYANGGVGPDIGWKIPNGFRWSQRWFADASIRGFSRRRDGEDFWAWNNGDATAQINANLIQTGSWSLGINTSFRSVYQGDQAAGGSTRVGEGVSSGFRIATSIGDTAGIAFGGEQILQWDQYTDTGRNFYLMASKGWWLGAQGRDFPLLIANGGFGTGRWATDPNLQFACINNVQNRTDTYAIDNNLCWSPIGTISLVMNEWWGLFVEYNSAHAVAAASMNLTGGIPLRLTWGVRYPTAPQFKDVTFPDDLTWVFRASLGF